MKIDFDKLILHVSIALISILILLVIRTIGFRILGRWAKKTETMVDDIIIQTFKLPSIYWSFAIGIYIWIEISDLPRKYEIFLTKTIYVLVIFSITIAVANLLVRMFNYHVQKSNLPIPTTGLADGVLKGIVITIGILIILTALKISITPIITALGIGGLAVALGLQDTLTNLFAGIQLLIEKSVRVGDFIKLESGQEGFVDDITWRTARIRMLSNNVVVIPNVKLAQSIVTNYSLPEKRMSLSMTVSVSYSSDPGKVEKVLVEEAKKAVGEVPGLLGEPEPFVRFIPGFGDSSLDFTLIYQVNEFTDQYLVQHELRKRIFERFRQEGIEIPFPHRTVYLREEKDWKK